MVSLSTSLAGLMALLDPPMAEEVYGPEVILLHLHRCLITAESQIVSSWNQEPFDAQAIVQSQIRIDELEFLGKGPVSTGEYRLARMNPSRHSSHWPNPGRMEDRWAQFSLPGNW